MIFIFKKLKPLLFFICFFNLNVNCHAHFKGMYSNKDNAIERSLELGCIGVHKNKDKWLPCKGEEELHEYLRK